MTSSEAPRALRGALFAGIVAGLVLAGEAWALVPVMVVDDGVARTAVVLRGTVADALRQARIDLLPADEVVPPAGQPVEAGMRIQVVRAFPVTVEVDGRSLEYRTTGGTVADALAALEVRLGPLDRVEPAPDSPLQADLRVQVVRVREERVTWRETVPYRTLRWAEPRWERGRTGVLREGRPGLVEHTDRLRYENGVLVARTRESSRVLVEKVDEIIGVGTRIVWRTVQTPLGPVRYREKLEMVATAYYPGPESTGKYADGLTATGMRAGHGVVAVDPRVIPLGTRLYIPGYGFAIAGDVGSAIKGRRIDLGYDTLREALHFGRRKVTVYVLN